LVSTLSWLRSKECNLFVFVLLNTEPFLEFIDKPIRKMQYVGHDKTDCWLIFILILG